MDLNALLPHFTARVYSRGDLLVREGQVCNSIYFVKKGLIKLFSLHGEREFVMHFFSEGMLATVVDSYTFQRPGHFQIKALEDSEVLVIHKETLEGLCKQSHEIESFIRQQVQFTAARMHERITDILENDAKNSYEMFLKKHPDLMQRISLGDLANYLGITQASLSKIRAK